MIFREDFYAGIFFAAVGIGIPAVVIAHQFFGFDPMAFAGLGSSRYVVGWTLALLAGVIALLNICLTYVVPWLHEREHGDMEDYSNSSGLPIIGGFFVLFAGALLPASPAIGVLLLVVYLADTGGLPCFFLTTVVLR
jgi:hypothetical protein